MTSFRSLALLLFVAVALSSCSSVPLTGRKRLSLVSDEAILSSSFQQYREFMAQAPRSSDARQTQRVVQIGRKIAAATDAYLRAAGLPEEAKLFSWEFNLVRSNQVNAFCMPGGKIVVYEGLLRHTPTDDELAVVIAHEVAHAVAKHANERMSQQLVQQYGFAILSVALSTKSPQIQSVAGQVFGLGSQVLVMLPYSRKHEYEADKIGLYLMGLAGYKVESALLFWQKMAQGSGGGNADDFLSTHPSDSKRIAAIQAEIPSVRTFLMGSKQGKQKTLPQPRNTTTLRKQEARLNNANRKVPIKTNYR